MHFTRKTINPPGNVGHVETLVSKNVIEREAPL